MPETEQMKQWCSDFGREYTERNTRTNQEMNRLAYTDRLGISRTELNTRFIGHLDKSSRILEVGCNRGDQVEELLLTGYGNVYAIELQPYASQKAKLRLPQANIIQGDALDIPFKDGFFDLVHTSVVLIHIAPENLGRAMDEIYRCSKRYIFGFEHWAQEETEINYRGNPRLLWKNDFPTLFQERFPDLTLLRCEHLKELDSDKCDVMYLLEKS